MGPLDKDVPPRRSLAAVRWRAVARPMWSIFLKGLYSPVVNAGAFFGLLTIPFSLFFISAFLGERGVTTRIDTLGATMLSTIAALPIWAVIQLVMTPFKAIRAENELGLWQEGRFIYRQPQLVLTAEWRPNDNGKFIAIPLKIDGGLLIDYKIEIDGPVERINCLVLGAYFFRPLEGVLSSGARFELRGRVVVKKDRTVGLHCSSLPDTLPALVRVYVMAFENDPTLLMDYTDLRTQTRFVLRPPESKEPVENECCPTQTTGETKKTNCTENSAPVSGIGAP